MARFSAARRGIEVRLEAPESMLLRRIPTMVGAVGVDEHDPAYTRLNPAAYPEDEAAQHEYARLVAPDLDEARRADRESFATTLDEIGRRGILTGEQAEAWVRVIGDARLVLGARLGIESDDVIDFGAATDDPDLGLLVYLGVLQDELVQVMLEQLERVS